MSKADFYIIEDKSDNKISIFIVKGSVCYSNSDILHRKLYDVVRAGYECIVLNMRDISLP